MMSLKHSSGNLLTKFAELPVTLFVTQTRCGLFRACRQVRAASSKCGWTIDSTAAKLAHALSSGTLLRAVRGGGGSEGESDFDVDRVTNIAQAYEVQNCVAKIVQSYLPGHSIAGWKIGATSSSAQKRMGLSEPFFGPLFQRNITLAPAPASGFVHTVERKKLWHLRGAELEYAFEIGRDVHARPNGSPWCSSSILSQVWFVYPAIELVSQRIVLPAEQAQGQGQAGPVLAEVPLPCRVADQALHGHAVLSPLTFLTPEQWAAFVARTGSFLHEPMCAAVLKVDGQVQARGTGAEVMGNPASAVAWLANALLARGTHLRAGQYVISGTMTGLTPLPIPAAGKGVRVEGDFQGFGSVKLQLV